MSVVTSDRNAQLRGRWITVGLAGICSAWIVAAMWTAGRPAPIPRVAVVASGSSHLAQTVSVHVTREPLAGAMYAWAGTQRSGGAHVRAALPERTAEAISRTRVHELIARRRLEAASQQSQAILDLRLRAQFEDDMNRLTARTAEDIRVPTLTP